MGGAVWEQSPMWLQLLSISCLAAQYWFWWICSGHKVLGFFSHFLSSQKKKKKVLAIYLIPSLVALEQIIVRTIFFPKYLSKRSSFFGSLILQPHTGFSHHILKLWIKKVRKTEAPEPLGSLSSLGANWAEEKNQIGHLKAECTWEPSVSFPFGSGSASSLTKFPPNTVKSPSSFPVQALHLTVLSLWEQMYPHSHLHPPPAMFWGEPLGLADCEALEVEGVFWRVIRTWSDWESDKDVSELWYPGDGGAELMLRIISKPADYPQKSIRTSWKAGFAH